jgi:creatinine amidohydrolase
MPELARLTWQETRDALTAARLALLPVGACEQHGPHLTLDTDLGVAEGMARRLLRDLRQTAILCPAIPYGLSEHHLAFAGTLTLRPATFMSLVLEVVESLAHWGLRRVLVVNGHAGNIDALRLVARSARRDHDVRVAAVMWLRLAADEIAERAASPTYGHACEVETSAAMVLAPQCVRLERVGAPGRRATPDPLTEPQHALVDRATWLHEWTEDGALGDPRLAGQELGEAVVEAAYRRALSFARRFADEPAVKDVRDEEDGNTNGR